MPNFDPKHFGEESSEVRKMGKGENSKLGVLISDSSKHPPPLATAKGMKELEEHIQNHFLILVLINRDILDLINCLKTNDGAVLILDRAVQPWPPLVSGGLLPLKQRTERPTRTRTVALGGLVIRWSVLTPSGPCTAPLHRSTH